MPKVYDAIILGGGPAGLSTALALGRVHRTCVVFSSQQHRNEGATAHSILTRDHTPSKDLLTLGRKDIEKYGNCDFVETTITSLSKSSSSSASNFTASNSYGTQWLGRTVVLASGVHDIFPDLPGYGDNWPHNIYQCPFCDGHERWQQPVGILCYPTFEPRMAKMATMAHFMTMPPGSKSCGKSYVTLFTNGPVDTDDVAVRKILDTCAGHGISVIQSPITHLEKVPDSDGLYIHLSSPTNTTNKIPSKIKLGWMLHKPPTTLNARSLIDQTGVKTIDGMFGPIVEVTSPVQTTNVPGVFVCGDAGANITHVTNAMMTGTAAAGGVAHFVGEMDDEDALGRYGKAEQLGDYR